MVATRTRLVERQVFAAASRIERFVDYLGLADVPADERPASPVAKARTLFQPPPVIEPNKLPRLPDNPTNYSGIYIVEWFEAFRRLAIDNAGHAAGRDITPQQNARLGQIISIVEGSGSTNDG